MGSLSINNVTKSCGSTQVLKGITIDIADGEFLILVGPSGCGKSTLMNMIAGLESVTSGELLMAGKDVTHQSPKDRDIAMVFQSYALYPTMNVARNISFGLEMRKVPKPERDRVVSEVANLLQIDHLLDRKPSELSGGQRQRVAMGRALARSPEVFLFDEPLSNLDAKLRVEMRTEIKKLHKRLGTTIVYVTHDQIEAMTLADRIAVMKDGVLQQLGVLAARAHEIFDGLAEEAGRSAGRVGRLQERLQGAAERLERVDDAVHEHEAHTSGGLVGAARKELVRLRVGASGCDETRGLEQ